MAKIALVFLFAFCVFQISTAARVPRDVEPQSNQNAIDGALLQINQLLEKTFNKENIDKFGATLKQLGDQIAEKSKALVQDADAKIKQLQANDPKQ